MDLLFVYFTHRFLVWFIRRVATISRRSGLLAVGGIVTLLDISMKL